MQLQALERTHERRLAAPETRHLWTASVPFQLPEDEDVKAQEVARGAEARRSRVTGPYFLRAVCTDAALAFLVSVVALGSLFSTRPWALPGAALAAAVWLAVLAITGGYDRRHLGDGPEEFGAAFRAGFGVVGVLGLLSYSLELELPRRDVLVAVPLITGLTMVGRYAWRRWLHAKRAKGHSMLRTLVVGEPTAVGQVVQHLRRERYHGIEVVGACLPTMGTRRGTEDVQLLGSVSEVPQVVVDHHIDTVIVVGAQLTGQPLRRLSWALERTGADLMVAPGLVEVTGAYVSLRPAAGLSLLRVERPAQRSGRLLAKSVLDRSFGLLLFLVAAPMIALAALAVRLTSPGDAFYAQPRVGRDGKVFTMWKLRSMVVGAERQVDDLSSKSDRDGLMFKMRQDPRVTPVGRFLRRYSVDELPQLWNVVRGDMSLVGPRPPLPREYALYQDATHVRLRVKPGLTGLWQVSGRADLPWEESVRLDLRYVDNWSPTMDLQILWKTFRAVMSGSGAY